MPDVTAPAAPAATAAQGIAAALLRHAITAAGSAIVARGWVDQSTATSAVGPLSDYALGVAMMAGASAWAWARAHLTHTRWAEAWRLLNGQVAPSPAPVIRGGYQPATSDAGPPPTGGSGESASGR